MQHNCSGFAALFAVLLITAGGCSSARPTVPDLPHRDVVLTIACAESLTPLLQPSVRAWQARHKAGSARFVPFDPAAPPDAHVWILPAWQLPRWITTGNLQPLPDTLLQRDGAGLLPIDRDSLVTWPTPDRTTPPGWAIPLIGEAPLLCYRADLYADPKHQQAYHTETGQALAPPGTWPEFVRQAEYFAKQDGRSVPALPTDPVALERLFGQVAAGYARRPVIEGGGRQGALPESALALYQDLTTGAPALDHPAFVHALQLLQTLQQHRAAAGAKEPEELFRDGKAALCVCEAPWLVRFQEAGDAGSKVRDKFNVAPLPGAERVFTLTGSEALNTPNRMPYLGTDLVVAALPAQLPDHQAAALSLLGHLLDRDTSNALVVSPALAGRAVRSEQLDERMRWDVFGLDQARTRATTEALRSVLLHRTLRNPALALRLPDTEEHRALLVAQLRRALLEGVPAKTALATAAQGWRQLQEKAGPAASRAAARASVGLLP